MARAHRLEMRRGFKPDHKDFGRFILSEQARDPAVAAAKDVAKLAAANSAAAHGSGDLASNYKVNGKTAPVVVGGNPRVGAEVYNDKRYAAAREFGRGRKNGTRALRRAGAAVGELKGDIG